jgi:hypothetical protein
VHYISSREALRKHGIDRLPCEVYNDVMIPTPSKKTKSANLTTSSSVTHEAINDGTIRAEDCSDANRTDAYDIIMNINNDETENMQQ